MERWHSLSQPAQGAADQAGDKLQTVSGRVRSSVPTLSLLTPAPSPPHPGPA